MRHRQLRFSSRAVQDIQDALDYTLTQFGEQKRGEYKALIRQALAEIAADPECHRAKRRPELHRDARTFHIGRVGKRARHFFVFRIAGDEFIDVGRLLHDVMELKRHIPDEMRPTE